jgi:hypothetical protein
MSTEFPPEFDSPSSINTLNDLIAALEIARETQGGESKVRWVRDGYQLGNKDDFDRFDEGISQTNQSLKQPNGVVAITYTVLACC